MGPSVGIVSPHDHLPIKRYFHFLFYHAWLGFYDLASISYRVGKFFAGRRKNFFFYGKNTPSKMQNTSCRQKPTKKLLATKNFFAGKILFTGKLVFCCKNSFGCKIIFVAEWCRTVWSWFKVSTLTLNVNDAWCWMFSKTGFDNVQMFLFFIFSSYFNCIYRYAMRRWTN